MRDTLAANAHRSGTCEWTDIGVSTMAGVGFGMLVPGVLRLQVLGNILVVFLQGRSHGTPTVVYNQLFEQRFGRVDPQSSGLRGIFRRHRAVCMKGTVKGCRGVAGGGGPRSSARFSPAHVRIRRRFPKVRGSNRKGGARKGARKGSQVLERELSALHLGGAQTLVAQLRQ